MNLQFFSIYYADLTYNDTQDHKDRPVLVIEISSNKDSLNCLKVTDSRHFSNYSNYIIIKDWKEAGLAKESLIDLDEIYSIPKKAIRRYVGRLSESDLNKLLSTNLVESKLNEDAFTKAWMIRDDGKEFEVYTHHIISKDMSSEKNLQAINWFYHNTQHDSTRKLIALYIQSLGRNSDIYNNIDFEYKSVKVDPKQAPYFDWDSNELFNEVFVEYCNEFVKARIGGMYFDEGGGRSCYVRIASQGKNWYNQIWMFVANHKNSIDKVTVCSDDEVLDTPLEYKKLKGADINEMPIDEFLNVSGNPIVEQYKTVREMYGSGHSSRIVDYFYRINEKMNNDAPWVKNTINTVSNTDKDPAVKATKAWSKMKVKSLKKGQMITEDTSGNTTINVEVNLPEIVSEALPSRDINATYDEQVIEDWWAFVEDVEDLVNDNFNVMSMSTSNVINSLSEYIDFYKNDHTDENKCVIDMRVSNHKQTKSAKKHRKNKVSSLGDNYEMLTVTVNNKTYKSYEEAFEDIKQKLEIIKGDKLEVFNECMIVENKKLHLEEDAGKTAVLIWGRMNPITKAHMAMIEFAEEQEGDTFVYLSHSQDKEKNPLPYDRKIYWAQKAAGNVVKESDARVVIQALQELQGYDNLIYICGSDRYEEMKELLNKYNGKPDKKGNIPYSFNSIEIRQFGNERIEEDLSLEQCSASLARKCAKEDDFETFKQVVPFDEEDARELFEELRTNMSINESLKLRKNNFETADIIKHNNRYYDSVVSDFSDKGVRFTDGSIETIHDEDLLDKLRSLDNIESKEEKKESFEALTGLSWRKIDKSPYSGYRDGGPGKKAERETLSDASKNEILSQLLEYYKENKYPTLNIETSKIVNIEEVGSANTSLVKLMKIASSELYNKLFTEKDLFKGEEDVWGLATADIVYTIELDLGSSKKEEKVYLSIKDGKGTSNLNIHLSKLSIQEVLQPIVNINELTFDEKNALTSLWFNVNGNASTDSCAVVDGDIKHTWYHQFDSNVLKIDNFANYMINSYRCGYFYCKKYAGRWEVTNVDDMLDNMRDKDSISDARMYLTQSQIAIAFNFGVEPVKVNIRQRGKPGMTCEIRGGLKYGSPKGERIDDLSVVDNYIKCKRPESR